MNTSIFQLSSAFILGLLIVFYSIPVIVRIAHTKQLYDEPNDRRVNKVAVPSLGGISLFLGIALGAMLGLQEIVVPDFRYMMISTIILLFIGVKDDLLDISPLKKVIAQLICAFILIGIGGIRFTNFHGFLGLYEIDELTSFLFSTVFIVGVINAINLIDGIDGLAASIAMLASVVLGVNFLMLDKLSYAIMCMAMTGSLLAFLAFNLFGGKNKIFMGDTGSLMMGLLLASLIIRFNEFSISQNQILSNFSPVLSTAIIAIPLIDMIRLFFIRMMKNKSPFSPDMNHIHHQLLALGLSHLMATTIITAFTILLVGMAYAFRNLNNHLLIILIILGTAMFMIIPSIIAAHTKPQRSTVKKIDFRNYVFPSRKFKQAWNPNAELTRKEPEQEAQEQQSV